MTLRGVTCASEGRPSWPSHPRPNVHREPLLSTTAVCSDAQPTLTTLLPTHPLSPCIAAALVLNIAVLVAVCVVVAAVVDDDGLAKVSTSFGRGVLVVSAWPS